MELSRRDILKNGAVLAAGVMGATALAGCSSNAAEQTALAETGEGSWDREADIVIVGAGMGGMCAGIQALENSERERDLLFEALHGRTVEGVAETLFLSRDTVKTYLSRAYARAGVNNKQAVLKLIDEWELKD